MNTIVETWSKIDSWLNLNAPDIAGALSPAVSSNEVAELEKRLGFDVPEELKESLGVHDGETEDEAWIFVDWSLLSAVNIAVLWERESQKPSVSEVSGEDDRVQPVVWSAGWIPFAYDGSGGYLAVDTTPGDAGVVGQIIRTQHDGENVCIASCLSEFLDRYRSALESGVFESDDEELEVKSGNEDWWKK